MEREVGGGFREQNPLHAPYIRICKILTSYQPPRPEILQVIGGTSARLSQPLERIGNTRSSVHWSLRYTRDRAATCLVNWYLWSVGIVWPLPEIFLSIFTA